MGARLDPQQAEQQVVPLPRPQPQVPRGSLVVRQTPRAERRGAMQRRKREGAREGVALEVLRAVALDHPERARMPGEAGGLGEHTVHDEPLFGAERREVPLRQVLLERDAGVLDGAPCCLERRPRLAQGLLRHVRSEEHTSELQSQSNLVCRLLLEKKKTSQTNQRLLNAPR